MTIDTACSGSLVSVDVGCQYLQSRQADAVIVAGANLYMSPDHNQDMGAMRGASSATGRCHTFDAKADGYIKAEAVNAVFLKRLDDAIRDGDPIRAVIRGTATNSDGWTPGIASPSSEAQAVAIRSAYTNAGIDDLDATAYLECHGTGTLAGDPIEVNGAASVFQPSRRPHGPLIIGSIKSNIGHSEPAAGISGLLKAVLAVENGRIPGNPTFVDPNPKIEFERLGVQASRWSLDWPRSHANYRRASVNSFGFGGSNAHVVVDAAEHFLSSKGLTQPRHVSSFVEAAEDDFFGDAPSTPAAQEKAQPKVLIFSANDQDSLKSYLKKLSTHLLNPAVTVKLADLAHTLSERRSRHFHRAFHVIKTSSDTVTTISTDDMIFGKRAAEPPKIGFVFTGQGAQWPQMGRDLIQMFPHTAGRVVSQLDGALKALPDDLRPTWTLRDELTQARSPEHLRLPEFSQPLVTALQLAYLAVLASWGIRPRAVVGHSSGEIAAACAAGLLTPEDAIRVAYFRGLASRELPPSEVVGMLAVGTGAEGVQRYLEAVNPVGGKPAVQIACYNSPSSLTLSGTIEALEAVRDAMQADGVFARMLQVSMAYHSRFMNSVGKLYEQLLLDQCSNKSPKADGRVTMFSSVTGTRVLGTDSVDFAYWTANMLSPVRFAQACGEMLSHKEHGVDFLVEIGPSNALSGPIKQVQKALPGGGKSITYTATAKRGPDTILALYDVPGRLYLLGADVAFPAVNRSESVTETESPATLVDLPNYAWNHSTKYWHESEASKDWRYRKFVHHDLLGTKVLNTSWTSPVWKKTLRLEDVPWLKDHRMGPDIIFPGAGYISMAVEAIYQATFAVASDEDVQKLTAGGYHYRLRDLKFPRALVLEENVGAKLMLTLYPVPGSTRGWFEYKVSSLAGEVWVENSTGFIRLDEGVYHGTKTPAPEDLRLPLEYPTPGSLWYKAMHDAGYNFGKDFQKQLAVESTPGQRTSRSIVSLVPPPSKWTPQSSYPLHPACIDGCFQSVSPSLWKGERSGINAVLVPAGVDGLVINSPRSEIDQELSVDGLSVTESQYLGIGRLDDMRNYLSNGTVYSPTDKSLVLQLNGLRYHRLETRSDVYTAHTYTQLSWKPDFSYLTSEEKLDTALSFASDGDESPIQEILDLAAHKKPDLSVLELKLNSEESFSLWLAKKASQHPLRAAAKSYRFATSNPTALVNAQEKYADAAGASFSLFDVTKAGFKAPDDEQFDLVVVEAPHLDASLSDVVLANLRTLVADQGALLVTELPALSNGNGHATKRDVSESLALKGFSSICKFSSAGTTSYLARAAGEADIDNESQTQEVAVLRLVDKSNQDGAVSQLISSLRGRGWNLSEHTAADAAASLRPKSTVLVLDELEAPVMATASEAQWNSLKQLVQAECNLLWVTRGAQLEVTDPLNAVAIGFLRTVRAEEPLLSLLTLDVEASTPLAHTVEAVDTVLRQAGAAPAQERNEFEFVERRGILHVSRVLPDTRLNAAKFEDLEGTPARPTDLHASNATIRLVTERLGNIDSLHYVEVADGRPLPLAPGKVEVELFASALNFKDVAVSMGIVPENEHLLGLEGAGVIVRVGEGVENRHVGQRVVVFEKGTFANRIIATTERTFPLPNSMTYEEAATLPAVYLTSIYSLFYLAQLKQGDTVLIHSASGGVGIASIQLAQYKKCEVGGSVQLRRGDKKRKTFFDLTYFIYDRFL